MPKISDRCDFRSHLFLDIYEIKKKKKLRSQECSAILEQVCHGAVKFLPREIPKSVLI